MNRKFINTMAKLENSTGFHAVCESIRKGYAACFEARTAPETGYFDTVEDFPTWAITYAMYGDPSGLTDEDIDMVDKWLDSNGYARVVSADESTKNTFCAYPAFGKSGTETETVTVALQDMPEEPDGNPDDLPAETV